MSLMMNNFSPGLMSPSSRRAISSMAAGSSLQPSCVFPQPRVLGSKARQIGSQLIILFAGPHRGDQSLIADQRVDDEHAHDEKEQPGRECGVRAVARAGLPES